MEAVKTITNGNFVGKIYKDEHAWNPLHNEDFLGTFICGHRRYELGHEHGLGNLTQLNSWHEVEARIKKEYGKDAIILPLYIYDHSGITISTEPFSCPWDSGQVGYVVVSREVARLEYGVKRITGLVYNRIINTLKSEVKRYDNYLTGNVYGYGIVEVVTNGDDEAELPCEETLWGWYGYDGIEEELTAELQRHVDHEARTLGIQTELELSAA